MNLPDPSPRFRIVLAPMQGVIDAPMRARLTSLGGYDRCVTEFVRVSGSRLPERVFLRLCPELHEGGCTPSGTPVYVQLLGSDPTALAANACRAAALGAPGIDLNFGCPAKTVNRSEGGSVLLREPARVTGIVAAVREAVQSALDGLGPDDTFDLIAFDDRTRTLFDAPRPASARGSGQQQTPMVLQSAKTDPQHKASDMPLWADG